LLARLVVALLATLTGLVLMAAVLAAALTRILRLLSRLLTALILAALVLAALVLLAALVWIIHLVPLGLSSVVRQLGVTTGVPHELRPTADHLGHRRRAMN
jgi:predicted PurR-regulated permease PerM